LARHGRGWLTRRLLLAADVLGLVAAFAITELIHGAGGDPDEVSLAREVALLVGGVPAWLVGAKLFGLYDRDEQHADYSTVDDLVRVFLLATVSAFGVVQIASLTGTSAAGRAKLTTFWLGAIVLVSAARIVARAVARRSPAYVQKTIIVGAGEVGQLVARKLHQHPEFGIDIVGFVDADPLGNRHPAVEHVRVLGGPERLRELVAEHGIQRVIFAFSRSGPDVSLPLVRRLRDMSVQVDVVPRLFEVIGPKLGFHSLEGLVLMGLPPVRLSRSSTALKRVVDVTGATLGICLTLPLFLVIGLLIKFDSPGPMFFRQRRLGRDMREFTMLKFRTMRVDTDDAPHRAFIAATMDPTARAEANGLYKLARDDAVTRVGRFLRATSLDELPQLLNVVRGDMSLVGPRPCLPYETETFAAHHFDRFLVPAGITGLWQVSARGRSTFGESLELDVLYAKSWSLGLDFALLARTPLMLFRSGTTA
jgi:exopolysaccharide biosynthesis polyprenyl glycosylphosphotransferase